MEAATKVEKLHYKACTVRPRVKSDQPVPRDQVKMAHWVSLYVTVCQSLLNIRHVAGAIADPGVNA